MAKVMYNPSTGKVRFNPLTGKIQMVGTPCSDCPPDTTPRRIKVMVNGILYCPNLGVCCYEAFRNKYKIINQGVDWNFELILEQGACYFNAGPYVNDILWYPNLYPCMWGCIKDDNYGAVEIYNLENCLGGIERTLPFYRVGVNLQRLLYQGVNFFKLEIGLACPADETSPTVWIIYSHMGTQAEYDASDGCLPYNIVLPNQHICGEDHCVGDGSVILEKLE